MIRIPKATLNKSALYNSIYQTPSSDINLLGNKYIWIISKYWDIFHIFAQ